jgi:hypothetical protein
MPNPKVHGEIDIELFGHNYFEEVHKWIDGTFDGTNGRTHWANRHYVGAVLYHFNSKDFPDDDIRRRLISVAKMHILFDWSFYYHRIVLPYSREDVIRELRSEGIIIE